MIELKLKPVKYTDRNIDDLRKKILHVYHIGAPNYFDRYKDFRLTRLNQYGQYDRSGSNYVYYNKDLGKIRLISINNQNARYEKVFFKSGKRKGELKECILVQKKEWNAFVYDIPVDIFHCLTQNGRMVITQHKHHHTIKKADK